MGVGPTGMDVGVEVLVDARVGVAVGAPGVQVGVGVLVGDGVEVSVAVGVGVAVGPPGVWVGGGVEVLVAVGVGVAVGGNGVDVGVGGIGVEVGVAVAVGVRVGVGVGPPGAALSKAPISVLSPFGRDAPKKSRVTSEKFRPASIAGLMVWRVKSPEDGRVKSGEASSELRSSPRFSCHSDKDQY